MMPRDALLAARDNIAAAGVSVDIASTGFGRAPYEKRAGAAHCVHGGYLHIGSGMIPGSHLVGSRYRTNDFMRAEKMAGTSGMPTTVFSAMASFDGSIRQTAGFDQYPWVGPPPGGTLGTDYTTDACYSSVTGAVPWLPDAAPSGLPPRETHMLLAHNGKLFDGLGEGYNPAYPGGPLYYMPRAIWKRSPGGSWTVACSDYGFNRRHFGYISVGTRAYLFGGASDLQLSGNPDRRTCFNDILYTDDDFATIQSAGNGPFEKGYGRRAVIFKGHIILTPCAVNTVSPTLSTSPTDTEFNLFSDPVAYAQSCWAVPIADAANPAAWFQIDDLPVGMNHSVVGVLNVNGVETLGVISGYGYVNGAYGAIGHVYTLTSLTGQWQARTDSDFWVS